MARSAISAFCATVSLVLFSSPAAAAIFNVDDRVVVAAQPQSPYGPIGIVSVGSQRGTGFLVSDCHVLTVKHVFRDLRQTTGRKVRFRAAVGGRDNSRSSDGVVIASGDYTRKRADKRRSEDRSGDWMLVRLDHCLGRALGHVTLGGGYPGEALPKGTYHSTARAAGFPVDKSSRALVMDPQCAIHARTSHEWLHDCATLPGNSGGPIFKEVVENGQVRLHVVAMITGGHHWQKPVRYDDANSNRATPVGALMPAISKYLGQTGTTTVDAPESE